MISKEKFVYILNRLKNYNDLQDKINDLFKDNIDNREMDFCNAGSICIGHETIVVDLLKDIFQDEFDDISFWIYELDYGAKYTKESISDSKGNPIDISTAEKLYDYLIKNMEEK